MFIFVASSIYNLIIILALLVLVRHLGLGSVSVGMSSSSVRPVEQSSVRGSSVVPDNHRAVFPSGSNVEVGALGDDLVQEVENQIRLLLLETDDVSGELGVDKYGLLASGRVGSDNGVDVGHGLSSDNTSSSNGSISLLMSRVHSLESLQTLLELGRKSVVGLGVIREESVSSCSGHLQDTQEGGSRRLLLVGDIRVPGDRRQVGGKVLGVDIVSLLSEDEMHLGVSLGRSRSRVNVLSSKVLGVLEGVLDGQLSEVLVSENNHSSLSNVVGKLVLGLVGQLGELNSSDLRSKLGGQIIDGVAVLGQLLRRNQVLFVVGGNPLVEQVRQSLVGSLTGLLKLELLVGLELLALIPARSVLGELERRIMCLRAGSLVTGSPEGGGINGLDSVCGLSGHCVY